MADDLRQWILPALAIVSLLWQIVTALRKNAVRREDLAPFATINNLTGAVQVLQTQIDDGDKECTRSHHRIEMVEQRIKTLPDFADINRLRDSVSQLDRNVGAMAAEVKGIDQKVDRTSDAVDRIEQHLLGRAA